MKTINENYVCSICGKKSVKLWHPYIGGKSYLICAECAEKHQTPMEYQETIWYTREDGSYTGEFATRKIPLPKWSVDEEGKVPSYHGSEEEYKTDQLIVDLSDMGLSITTLVPAAPDEDGNFSEEICKWTKLPTR